MPRFDNSITPWRAGSFRGRTAQLLFGAMYEDPLIELEAFAPASRVFCIASAGCTALALAAAGHEVTAVDINRQQVLYAKARASGAALREGIVERMLSRGRALLPLLGWTERRRREFLWLRNPAEQIQYWRHSLDTLRWRMALDALLSGLALKLFYAGSFITSLPRNFGACMRARLERGWSNHANRCNPYVWRLLLGASESPADQPELRGPEIRFACADAAAYLECCDTASFDAFSLSNIGDGAPPNYVARLHRAIRHAAAADAVVVSRSFREPINGKRNLAARDRSLLWGSVNVKRIGDFDLWSTD